MAEREQPKPTSPQGRVLRCDECEDLIAEALDGTLSPADAAAFARHQGECASCAQMLKETQQGKAWMQYLAVEPQVPADLLGRILARTTGLADQAGFDGPVLPPQAVPAGHPWHARKLPAQVLALRQLARHATRHALEPRLMMTVAMAFFSIALTLNLTGINLSQVRAADLQPARLRATLTRQYYATNEQVTKYYLNLRLVYEMEARVRELRRSTEAEPVSLETPRPSSSTRPGSSPGSSPGSNAGQPARDGSPSSNVPKGELPAGRPSRPQSRPQADTLLPVHFIASPKPGKVRNEVFRARTSTTEDQAERSLV